jgi:hypothetical protein
MRALKEFFKTKTGMQVYSFVKTFIVAFLAIAVFADSQNQDIFNTFFLIGALKASTLVVIRNIYKLLTE